MTLITSRIVHHNTLGLDIGNLRLEFIFIVEVLSVIVRQKPRQRPKADGESHPLAARVVGPHGLDNLGEDILVFADQKIRYRRVLHAIWLCSDNVGPRGANPTDRAIEVEIEDDVQCLFGSFSEFLPLVSDIFAKGSFHRTRGLTSERGYGGHWRRSQRGRRCFGTWVHRGSCANGYPDLAVTIG